MIGAFLMSLALAGEPDRYTLSTELQLPESGPVLIDLSDLTTTANRNDLLLLNGNGDEIPTRVLASWEPQQGGCAPAKWDPVGPPPRYERIRVDTRSVGRTIDRIVLDPGTVGAGFLSGILNVFWGDGSYAIPIEIQSQGRTVSTGLIWRANIAHADRENMTIAVDALPPGVYDIVAPAALRWRGVRVCWTATTDVQPVTQPLEVVGPMPSTEGRSRYEITLPGSGLGVMDITLAVDDPRFKRDVWVSTPSYELGSDPFGSDSLTQTTIERLALGGATIDHTVIEFGPGAHVIGVNRLILEIDDGRDKPLNITGATVRLANRALLLNDAGPGPHHLYAAPFVSEPGSYDLGHATVELLRGNPPKIRPVSFSDNPLYDPASALPAQLLVGGPADVRGYANSRDIVSTAAGKPTRWHLDSATLADVGDSLYTIRLVNAEGNQVPYVLEDGGWEKVNLESEREEETRRTRITVTLDGRYRVNTVVLRTDDQVFSRMVSVANGAGGRSEWTNSPGAGAAVLALPLNGSMDRFEILIDNGDDAPLGDIRLEIYAQTLNVVAIDPGPGGVLWYGNPKAGAPQYDLSMVGDVLRLGVVAEGQLGPIVRHTRASSEDKTLALVAVGVLALVLLGLAVMLVREPEGPADGAET